MKSENCIHQIDYDVAPNFCPECGEQWDEIEIEYPLEVEYYMHDQASILDIEDSMGIEDNEHPDLVDSLRDVGYEVKLTYEITGPNHTPYIIKVNGRRVEE